MAKRTGYVYVVMIEGAFRNDILAVGASESQAKRAARMQWQALYDMMDGDEVVARNDDFPKRMASFNTLLEYWGGFVEKAPIGGAAVLHQGDWDSPWSRWTVFG